MYHFAIDTLSWHNFVCFSCNRVSDCKAGSKNDVDSITMKIEKVKNQMTTQLDKDSGVNLTIHTLLFSF